MFVKQNNDKMILTHSKFGQGTLISQTDANVTVDFNGEIKTLIIKFANLTNEDGSAFGTPFVAPAKKVKSQRKISEQFAITSGGSFNDMFSSTKEREDWKDERAKKSFNSISW
jgi:hypothetical protein